MTITRDNSAGGLANIDGTFGLLITGGVAGGGAGGGAGQQRIQHLRCCSEAERDAWAGALAGASNTALRARARRLQQTLARRQENVQGAAETGGSAEPDQEETARTLCCHLSGHDVPRDPAGEPLNVR